jgi:hypothetical protein
MPPQSRPKQTIDDSEFFDIAIEHAAFCGARGDSPAKVILSVGQPLPGNGATWADAIYALVYAQHALAIDPRALVKLPLPGIDRRAA